MLDSYAWIEYLLASEKGLKVKSMLGDGNKVFTHVLSIAEISSRLSRSGLDHTEHIKSIMSVSEIINIDPEISSESGKLHSSIRKEIKDFGLVDSFILFAAKEIGAKIVTGDPHFKNMKEAVII